ncbi:nitric oxide dioxygenase [Bordetella pertussis STO1-CHOC-0018]|nr:nitric oxide dioxygenase [Bordetella pertussis STO1-CHOC-0018]
MLSPEVRALVKATAPVLKEHGEALTRHFYTRMLGGNPELRQLFNQGHQQSGQQQQALAAAVAAYAEHIDDPSVLLQVVERIAHKHVSLGVRAEHYAIVGKHLLASIREVLGEAATDELIDAWAAAYGQLADLLIGRERALYAAAASRDGGWTGWRAFKVVRKTPESAEITSFYLAPADGGATPDYLPGQYVSVRVYVPELGLMQPRQYSLSEAPGMPGQLRISVKREAGSPAGMVSGTLHNRINEGDVLDVSPPQGDFTLDAEDGRPVVLLSGGVGLTPMVSMLNGRRGRPAGGAAQRRGGADADGVHAQPPDGARRRPADPLRACLPRGRRACDEGTYQRAGRQAAECAQGGVLRARGRGRPARRRLRLRRPGRSACDPRRGDPARRGLLPVRSVALHAGATARPGRPGRGRAPHPCRSVRHRRRGIAVYACRVPPPIPRQPCN